MKLLAMMAALIVAACIGPGQNTSIQAQGESQFPQMTGIDLFGQDRLMPDTFEGRLNIVTVAFERNHQDHVNTWIAEIDPMLQDHKDLRFYEIPLIYEMNPVMRKWVNNGMRSGIPSDIARERTITVYTDRARFLNITNMQADRIYTLILDDKGRELWRAEGPVTEEKLENLKAFINTETPAQAGLTKYDGA